MLRSRRPVKPAQDRTNKEMAEIFKSLADENRLQILRILMREGELHVSKICDELEESQPAVSHHLTQLRHARLVDFRRDGKFNHYYISSDAIQALLLHFFPNAARAQQTIAFGDMEISFRTRDRV
ncbi:MAG TPA: metalloregulator ArsR/SmtB family transcription factor [Gemmataceae bacterium]|jgi:ArsR family transcriptional regulator|nr:metalloregulator ArsR/SmtB family transcription factor [Gemmataceae bacterium]